MTVGIVSYGGYVPRYRITPEVIGAVWGNDGAAMGKGLNIRAKSVPGPDEDVITMSVEAARAAMARVPWVSPKDVGAMVHETVHCVQLYRGRGNPGWLVEGVADYVRFFKYEGGNIGIKLTPERAKYDASYRVTAAFHAPGISETTFRRARTSSPRLLSCVDVADSADGHRRWRLIIQSCTPAGSRPNTVGSLPTSFSDSSRL